MGTTSIHETFSGKPCLICFHRVSKIYSWIRFQKSPKTSTMKNPSESASVYICIIYMCLSSGLLFRFLLPFRHFGLLCSPLLFGIRFHLLSPDLGSGDVLSLNVDHYGYLAKKSVFWCCLVFLVHTYSRVSMFGLLYSSTSGFSRSRWSQVSLWVQILWWFSILFAIHFVGLIILIFENHSQYQGFWKSGFSISPPHWFSPKLHIWEWQT